MRDELISRLTNEYVEAVRAQGFNLAVAIIDPEDEDNSGIGLGTDNASEGALAVAMMMAAILREGEPTHCPHCIANYRRIEKALEVMKEGQPLKRPN